MVARLESTDPAELLTLTQYEALSVSEGVVKVAEFVPTGVVVTPKAPKYH
jgi:hypothetical protein